MDVAAERISIVSAYQWPCATNALSNKFKFSNNQFMVICAYVIFEILIYEFHS